MKSLLVTYTKFDPDRATKAPVRAHVTDAGLDFFFNPSDGNTAYIAPGDSQILETNIQMHIPPGWSGVFTNRSSIASKQGLIVGACVVDSGYNGEIFINLINTGNDGQVIDKGTKLAQMRFVEVPYVVLEEHDKETITKLNRGVSEREDGGFGSTGHTE